MGSESDCLSGKLRRIFEISNSVAGLKVEKMGGVVFSNKGPKGLCKYASMNVCTV